jgi:hypothetical protein
MPSFIAVSLLDLVAMFVVKPVAVGILLFASLAYLGYLILRINDLARCYDQLGWFDQRVFRWSGVMAPLPVLLFLLVAYSLEAKGNDVNKIIFGNQVGWTVVAWLFEFGFILSCASGLGWRRTPHFPPAFVWRSISLLTGFVYAAYFAGTLTRGCGEMLK